MKKLITAFLISLLAISNVLSGCGKKASEAVDSKEETAAAEEAVSAESSEAAAEKQNAPGKQYVRKSTKELDEVEIIHRQQGEERQEI